jgi:hypothetical protein
MVSLILLSNEYLIQQNKRHIFKAREKIYIYENLHILCTLKSNKSWIFGKKIHIHDYEVREGDLHTHRH